MTSRDDDRTPAPAGERTEVLGSAAERTEVPPPDEEPPSTLHLGPADDHAPRREPAPVDAEYSATVLASHWIQRPGPDETLAEQPVGQAPAKPRPAQPDRVEGTVLRFGPGVTAVVAHRAHRTLPAPPPPPAPPRRGLRLRLRSHALPALVVLCVVAFIAWQRLGPPLAVGTVAVTSRPTVLGCDATAHIVGLVTTNGRPGTFSYRWIRSDGTSSDVLEEVVARGQRQARLHLMWTFQGKGHRTARAELRILSATPRTVTTHFTYDCA